MTDHDFCAYGELAIAERPASREDVPKSSVQLGDPITETRYAMAFAKVLGAGAIRRRRTRPDGTKYSTLEISIDDLTAIFDKATFSIRGGHKSQAILRLIKILEGYVNDFLDS